MKLIAFFKSIFCCCFYTKTKGLKMNTKLMNLLCIMFKKIERETEASTGYAV